MASAILDFWTYDMAVLAARLQKSEPGLQPYLFERPVLKFGATLVQLPWIVGMQNNSTAAINNLRYLHCSLCNTEWNVPRATCTACDTDKEVALQELEGSKGAVRAESE